MRPRYQWPPAAPLRRLWPAFLALIALGLLYVAIAAPLSLGPPGLVLGVIVVFVALYLVLHGRGLVRELHRLTWGLLVLLTLAIVSSVALLLVAVAERQAHAPSLLRAGALIWIANVVTFAWWYWMLDAGGPAHRHHHGYRSIDLAFPQLAIISPHTHGWQPEFVDYLFLAFNTSTAFSPTDTPVLSHRFKALMLLQSLLSLVVTGVLIARAVNTL